MNLLNTNISKAKETPSQYMKKVFKITTYALSVNKVFIVLMLVVSLLIFIICSYFFHHTPSASDPTAYIIIPVLLGFVIPVIMFQHMFKRKEFDFYAAMPLGRNRYFWGFTLAGIIAFLTIYIFVFAIMSMSGSPVETVYYFLPGLAIFFTVFSSALLAIMLSKSFFVFFLIFIILNAFVAEILYILWGIVNVNANLYLHLYQNIIYLFSPLSAADLFYIHQRDCLSGLLPLITAVIEFAAAFFLHRVRNNEGRSPLVFAKTRYPIQYIIMFMAAFLGCTALYYNQGRDKSISGFYHIADSSDGFFLTTIIVIVISFILTNMIFENTPRGVFRKIYHLFIFTASYAAILFLVIGGIIYPNLPENFVPFKSNVAVVALNSYDNKSRAEYDAVYDIYQKAIQAEDDYVSAHNYTVSSEDSEYYQLTQNSENAFRELQRWQGFGENGEYYYRSTDLTLYLITDEKYLEYLSGRVKENATTNNYVDYYFGYQGIVAKPAVDVNDKDFFIGNETHYHDYYYNNAMAMDIIFFDVNEEKKEELSKNFGKEMFYDICSIIRGNQNPRRYSIDTFVDSKEALEEFEKHTSGSCTESDLERFNIYFNENSF